jgi:hypothetical protein
MRLVPRFPKFARTRGTSDANFEINEALAT